VGAGPLSRPDLCAYCYLTWVKQTWCAISGCIKVKGVSFRPKVSAQCSALVQPERIGGHTIFESKRVVVDSPLGRILTGMLSNSEAVPLSRIMASRETFGASFSAASLSTG